MAAVLSHHTPSRNSSSREVARHGALPFVGLRRVPHSPTAPELDRLIVAAGEQMVAWYGVDHMVARYWLNQMTRLIARRTPRHQAAMHAQIKQRIEDPCYFSSDEAHR